MQNFLWENVWKSVRNYMEVIENIIRYVKNKNLKIDRWLICHPYANFNCPYLKIGLCDLFPVFVGVHHLCIHNPFPTISLLLFPCSYPFPLSGSLHTAHHYIHLKPNTFPQSLIERIMALMEECFSYFLDKTSRSNWWALKPSSYLSHTKGR